MCHQLYQIIVKNISCWMHIPLKSSLTKSYLLQVDIFEIEISWMFNNTNPDRFCAVIIITLCINIRTISSKLNASYLGESRELRTPVFVFMKKSFGSSSSSSSFWPLIRIRIEFQTRSYLLQTIECKRVPKIITFNRLVFICVLILPVSLWENLNK